MPNELLPTNIGFGTVVGRFGSAPLVAGDADGLPDFSPAAGLTVTFTPSTAAVIDATASPAPVTIEMVPIVCGLDSQGYLVGGDGQRGVKLIATDDTDINPSGWTYSVTFLRAGAKVAAFRDFSMSLPQGVTKDIALTIPVPSSSGVSLSQAQAAEAAAVSAASAASAAAAAAAASAATFVPATVDTLGQATTVGKALAKASDATAGRAALAAVGQGEITFTPEMFGAVGDGVADDTTTMQAAADAAAAAGRALYLPKNYLISSQVNISTPVVCDGSIVINTNTTSARLRFVRTATPTTLTAASLTGLTQGSRNIGGLGGALGTLAFTSTEHLLERNNGVGQFYTKADTQAVVNESGDIMPALDCTYLSTSALTAKLYPVERPITVDRLRVTLVGTIMAVSDHYVGVFRSDVTFERLKVTNTTTLKPINAVRVETATGVVFNSPVIHGFDATGLGYGVAMYSSSNVRINNATITRCRHSITGLNNKSVTLDGGSYDGTIDTHWGSDTKVLNLTGNAITGLPHISLAGKDLTVRNCTFNGGRVIFGIRNDSPEFTGTVLIEQVTWTTTDTGSLWIAGFTSATQPFFDYGRTLLNPDRTIIRDVRVVVPTGGASIVYGWYAADHDYPQSYWDEVEISRVRVVTTTGASAFWVAALTDKDSANHSASTIGTAVTLNDLDFTTTNSDNLIIRNTGDVSDSKGFALIATACQNLRLSLPENGMVAVVVRNSDLRRLRPVVSSAQAFSGAYLIEGSTITACAFTGTFLADFRSNTWVGASSSSGLTIDQRVKSYTGNKVAIGGTGTPSQGDGYRSTTYYAGTGGILPDVQVFTATGTWTRPGGATTVRAWLIGGGGGGGSGRQGAAGVARCGGGGGGGAGKVFAEFRASDLSATQSVVVGVGGAAGAAVSTADTNGNAGGPGGASTFATLRTFAATGGGGGTPGAGTAGAAGSGSIPGAAGSPASAVGGPGINTGVSTAGVGGASGGGITTGDVPGAGGTAFYCADGPAISQAGGTVPGGAGVAAPDRTANNALAGAGGGGGAASITGPAGAGGAGGLYGGGGGGGGASLNGNASGAGGAGAPGIVVVITQ